jgi:hypothetical protein
MIPDFKLNFSEKTAAIRERINSTIIKCRQTIEEAGEAIERLAKGPADDQTVADHRKARAAIELKQLEARRDELRALRDALTEWIPAARVELAQMIKASEQARDVRVGELVKGLRKAGFTAHPRFDPPESLPDSLAQLHPEVQAANLRIEQLHAWRDKPYSTSEGDLQALIERNSRLLAADLAA